MAKKPTVTTITSGYASNTQLNANFVALRDGFDNTLSLDGSTPNSMGAALDMNGFDILNGGTMVVADLTVAGLDVNTALNSAVSASAASAVASEASAVASAVSASSAALYDGPWLDDVAALLADTTLTLTPGQPNTVVVGDYVRTRKEGFSYEVVASGGDVATAGGIQLDVLAGDNGYDVKAFGAVGNGVTDDTVAIQAALNSGAQKVLIPSGSYKVGAGGLTWTAGVEISGGGSLLRSGVPTAPCLSVTTAGKFKISGIKFNDGGHSTQNGTLEINHANARVWITDCEGTAGYSSIWGKQAESIVVTRGDYWAASHPLYFGDNDVADLPATIGKITLTDVTARDALTGGDGVKTVSNVNKLVIKGGHFTGNDQDGIDLFAGCESVNIIGANCSGNTVNGIDIKVGDGTYPEATWGERRRILISGGFYSDNTETGVKIYGDAATGWFEDPAVIGAEITGNGHYGILCRANSPRIIGNLVVGNGHTLGSYAAVYMWGDASNRPVGGMVSKNVIANNGRTGATNVGITVAGWDGLLLEGNEIGNQAVRDEFAGIDWGLSVDAGCLNTRVANNRLGACNTYKINMAAGSGTIGYHDGVPLRVRGQDSVASGTTTKVITHGAAGRAHLWNSIKVFNIATANGSGAIWVSAATATTFTVSVDAAPSGTASFQWEVDLTDQTLAYAILV